MHSSTLFKAAWAGVISLALSFTVTACTNPVQKAQEGATEKILEGVAETSAGEKVDVDLGMAGSASYPEGWPTHIPVPNGAQILTAVKIPDGSSVQLVTNPKEAAATLTALRSQGWVEQWAQEGGDYRSYGFETPDGLLAVAFMTDSSEPDQVHLTYVLSSQ